MKKLYLNRKVNSILVKNLLNYLENYWREVSESALFLKEYISDCSGTESAKNTPYTLNVIRKNNINRLIFAHNNINFIRNKFDMLPSFFYQGFLSRALTTHRTAGEGRGPSYSTLPLPSAHEHSDIYLQLCTWDDYHIFLIAALVFTRLLLDEIYHPIELLFDWLMM